MTRPITAGVDGTEESLAALDWAAREAVRRGLPLRVVHAWEQVRELPAGRDTQLGWVEEGIGGTVRALAGRHPGLDVSARLTEDDAVDALLAAGADAEALVLGTRGHGAVAGFLLGSVGLRVVAEAARPVILVRAGDRAEAESAGREIVVGQHGSPQDSAAALRFAFGTAAARGATVRAVRAWTLPPVFAYSPGSLKLLDESGGLEPYEQRALADALRPWRERFPGVPVAEHVEMGSAGQVLVSQAARAQLLVVGRRARRIAVGARIGSVAHGVLHHAGSPVAVVPQD
ncbi:universal stress protein [Streptomyces sp. NPDC058459]|uniref:universal stress protein n=1 Tax=Streptomyces sp. NPDC058459 TaxID=3346508 RepID=UPI003654CB0C